MSFKQQFRSLTPEERDRFRELNPEIRQSIRAYIRVSGDRLAPFVTKDADPYGVPLPDSDFYDFQFSGRPQNRFLGRDVLEFGVIRNSEQTDVLNFAPGPIYQVERGSGDRRGYLISQLTTYGSDLLAVVIGENHALRSLSDASSPLSSTDFLS